MKPSGIKSWVLLVVMLGACVAVRFTGFVDDHIRYAASSAAASGNLQGLRVIRALGVDIGKPVPGRGPLVISAAWTGQTNVVAYLLSAGVDIETKDKFGGTALSRAAEMNQTDTVRLLLDHGANPNVRDLEGAIRPLICAT